MLCMDTFNHGMTRLFTSYPFSSFFGGEGRHGANEVIMPEFWNGALGLPQRGSAGPNTIAKIDGEIVDKGQWWNFRCLPIVISDECATFLQLLLPPCHATLFSLVFGAMGSGPSRYPCKSKQCHISDAGNLFSSHRSRQKIEPRRGVRIPRTSCVDREMHLLPGVYTVCRLRS
jgi:hypothetical protein